MGQLKRFNLRKIIKDFSIDSLIETGTWKGDGVAYALNYYFKNIITTEIVPEIAERAKTRFALNKNVDVITGNSIDIFTKILPEIKGNILFWLDAHFPGAEEGLNDYNAFKDEAFRLPLQKELELIKQLREGYNDFILVDDLRIYEDGKFANGNMPINIIPPSIRNLDFVVDLFGSTHEILRLYEDEGYMLIKPKIYSSKKNNFIIHMLDNIMNKLQKKIYV